MNLVGGFGRNGKKGGVAILCHPTTPGFPQRWILRRARSMQNPVYPGRHAVPLPMDSSLSLRYRLVVHRGQSDPKACLDWQKAYETR